MRKYPDKRKQGIATAIAGIACNLALSVAKVVVGATLGLISVAADGFNNLSDCGSGIVALVSVFVADKPADKQHPYGHRRAEYVSAMITGFLVLAVAVSLLGESVHKVIDGTLGTLNWTVYTVLGVSVVVKAIMFVFYRVVGRKISSDSLKAAATDSLCDCIATLAVIVSSILCFYGIAADGWAGIAVALFVGWQGVVIVREASSKLLGQAPDDALVNRIKSLILSFDGVLGLHDLRIFSYGDSVFYATVHVEMDASLPALQSHSVLDEMERAVLREESVELTAHLDPVDLHDEKAALVEQALRRAVEAKCPDGVGIHDFRVIRGTVDKLVFDVGVPFDCKLSDAEVEEQIRLAANEVGDYMLSVTVDRE